MTKTAQDKINAYLRGELPPAERHALEMQALSDPFLADALEGFQGTLTGDQENQLTAIQSRLQALQSVENAGLRVVWRRWLAVSAAAASLALATFVLWPARKPSEVRELAQQPSPRQSVDSLAAASASALPNPDSQALAANDPKLPVAEQSVPRSSPRHEAMIPSESASSSAKENAGLLAARAPAPVDSASGFTNDMASANSNAAAEEVVVTGMGVNRSSKKARAEDQDQPTGKQILLQRLQAISIPADTVAKPGLQAARYHMGGTSISLQAQQASQAKAVQQVQTMLAERLMLERLARPLPRDSGLIYLKLD